MEMQVNHNLVYIYQYLNTVQKVLIMREKLKKFFKVFSFKIITDFNKIIEKTNGIVKLTIIELDVLPIISGAKLAIINAILKYKLILTDLDCILQL